MRFIKIIFSFLFLVSVNVFGQSEGKSPCGDSLGEAIMNPKAVTDPEYYSNLIRKYDCDKAVQSWLYYYRAYVKYKNADKMGAMGDLTSSIETEPTVFGYYFRGVLKHELKDFKGAATDLTNALRRCRVKTASIRTGIDDITQSDIFLMRGRTNLESKQYTSAIQDFDNLILIERRNKDGYFLRAICEFELEQNEKACSDWRTSSELGDERAFEYISKNCQ